jgi:hypothetical protein
LKNVRAAACSAAAQIQVSSLRNRLGLLSNSSYSW